MFTYIRPIIAIIHETSRPQAGPPQATQVGASAHTTLEEQGEHHGHAGHAHDEGCSSHTTTTAFAASGAPADIRGAQALEDRKASASSSVGVPACRLLLLSKAIQLCGAYLEDLIEGAAL